MNFTVTYRDRNGALREEAVEAADRAACVAECRRRGIAPVKIAEGARGGRTSPRAASGWAGGPPAQRRDDARSPGKGRSTKAAAIGVLLLLLAAAAWWWLSGGRDEAQRPRKGDGAKARPAAADVRQRTPEPKPAATNAPPKAAEAPAKPEFVKRPGALQLPDGKVLTFPPPKEGETRKVYAYGHMYECDHEGNFRDVTKRQLFKTAFEANFLGLAVADKPFIPAFLKGLDQEDVKKILLRNYEAKGDETEEEMAQLRAYDDMRVSALQYMEEGGSFDDFVDYFAKQVKSERETNALCLREVMTLYKQGKFDEARDMAEAADALKRQKGLKGLKLPAHVRERLGM